MKKIQIFALSLLVFGGAGMIAGCSGKSGNKTVDSDSVAAELTEEVSEVPADSMAIVFGDDARKSETATDSTYAVTASGLKYMVLKEGNGKCPGPEDEVTVHYVGRHRIRLVGRPRRTRHIPAQPRDTGLDRRPSADEGGRQDRLLHSKQSRLRKAGCARCDSA